MPGPLLVVDDNKELRKMLSSGIQRGWKESSVLAAGNGLEALGILESRAVDFVLTDLEMPVMNGFEFIARARARYPALPILAMSGWCEPGIRERVEELGALGLMGKPFDLEQLFEQIGGLPDGKSDGRGRRAGSESSPARTKGRRAVKSGSKARRSRTGPGDNEKIAHSTPAGTRR